MSAVIKRQDTIDTVSDVGVEEEDVLQVVIRGHQFDVSKTCLLKAPESKLGKFIRKTNGGSDSSKLNVFRCNRNPFAFHAILDYYITGELHLPEGICGRLIKLELEYWEIGCHLVMPCCLARLESAEQTIRAVRHIQNTWRENVVDIYDRHNLARDRKTWKIKMENFLNNPKCSYAAQTFYVFYILVVLGSMLMLGMQTVQSFRTPVPSAGNITFPSNITLYEWLKSTYPPYWMAISDLLLLVIITMVQVARYICSPSTREFFSDPFNILEMIGNLPQWIPCTILVISGSVVIKSSQAAEHFMFALAVWKAWRVVPFIRALRHYRGMRMMAMALRASVSELVFLTIVLFVGSLLFGYSLYLSELWTLETNVLGLPDAMWWGVITMTTVGYGDIIPSTWVGKMVGFVCAVTGILMVALPVPIIATNFYMIHQNVKIADLKTCLMRTEEADKRKSQETVCTVVE